MLYRGGERVFRQPIPNLITPGSFLRHAWQSDLAFVHQEAIHTAIAFPLRAALARAVHAWCCEGFSSGMALQPVDFNRFSRPPLTVLLPSTLISL